MTVVLAGGIGVSIAIAAFVAEPRRDLWLRSLFDGRGFDVAVAVLVVYVAIEGWKHGRADADRGDREQK